MATCFFHFSQNPINLIRFIHAFSIGKHWDRQGPFRDKHNPALFEHGVYKSDILREKVGKEKMNR